MDLHPPLGKEASIGHLLGERMLEAVLLFGQELCRVDEPQLLQVLQVLLEPFLPARDRLQNPIGEPPPDHRGHLQGLLERALHPIESSANDSHDGARHLDPGAFTAQHIPVLLPQDGTVLQQAVGQLLDEERIATRLADDEFHQFWVDFLFLEDRLHQCRTGLGRKLIRQNLAAVWFSLPVVGVLVSVQKNQEDALFRQRTDQVVQESLRDLIDPMQVFHDEDEGLLTALPHKQITGRFEGSFPSLLGPELKILLVFDL